jgi:hypothetical protein
MQKKRQAMKLKKQKGGKRNNTKENKKRAYDRTQEK